MLWLLSAQFGRNEDALHQIICTLARNFYSQVNENHARVAVLNKFKELDQSLDCIGNFRNEHWRYIGIVHFLECSNNFTGGHVFDIKG